MSPGTLDLEERLAEEQKAPDNKEEAWVSDLCAGAMFGELVLLLD